VHQPDLEQKRITDLVQRQSRRGLQSSSTPSHRHPSQSPSAHPCQLDKVTPPSSPAIYRVVPRTRIVQFRSRHTHTHTPGTGGIPQGPPSFPPSSCVITQTRTRTPPSSHCADSADGRTPPIATSSLQKDIAKSSGYLNPARDAAGSRRVWIGHTPKLAPSLAPGPTRGRSCTLAFPSKRNQTTPQYQTSRQQPPVESQSGPLSPGPSETTARSGPLVCVTAGPDPPPPSKPAHRQSSGSTFVEPEDARLRRRLRPQRAFPAKPAGRITQQSDLLVFVLQSKPEHPLSLRRVGAYWQR
jgi:hypothetical protein